MLFGTAQLNAADRAMLARIERKLDALIAHLGIETPDDGLAEVRKLIAAGRKIEAIKRYREITGAGLAEAKSAVDSGLR